MADTNLEFEGPIEELRHKIEELKAFASSTEMDLSGQIDQLEARYLELQREVVAKLTAWERIQLARHPSRPLFSDYLSNVFTDTLELHGDQLFGDDYAIYTGLAKLRGRPVLVIGHRKGKNTKERIACNFGSAHPEGYRKALLKMRLAEKYRLPVIALIDTPGAYPGLDAEERGQAHAIARNILEMSRLRTPIVCLVIGEGGSGGALGIGVGDRGLMLENAYYSVISPEGCSSILWKSADHAPKAASILKLTAKDLIRFKIIDAVVPEPAGGAHQSIGETCRSVEAALVKHVDEIAEIPIDKLLEQRYQRVRQIGIYLENGKQNFIPEPEEDLSEGVESDASDSAGEAIPQTASSD
jgi:acetyl-CoA carboxylase carboxyl transferase subunit alpha